MVCPFFTYLFVPRVMAELDRLSLTFIDQSVARTLLVSLTLWTCSTALLISLHVLPITESNLTAAVSVAWWLTLGWLIILSLFIGMLVVIISVLFRYLIYTSGIMDTPEDVDQVSDPLVQSSSADLWSFNTVLSMLYACLSALYKFIYFSLRLWLLMTLHVFVTVALTQIVALALLSG